MSADPSIPSALPIIALSVYRDGWTKGIQISIGHKDGSGYRLAGPKFNGSGELLKECILDEYAATQIRQYLDQAFPLPVRP